MANIVGCHSLPRTAAASCRVAVWTTELRVANPSSDKSFALVQSVRHGMKLAQPYCQLRPESSSSCPAQLEFQARHRLSQLFRQSARQRQPARTCPDSATCPARGLLVVLMRIRGRLADTCDRLIPGPTLQVTAAEARSTVDSMSSAPDYAHPITYEAAELRYLGRSGAPERYAALSERDLYSGVAAWLQESGSFDLANPAHAALAGRVVWTPADSSAAVGSMLPLWPSISPR
jgi:hypothetical protein